jgi:hypothetical protein
MQIDILDRNPSNGFLHAQVGGNTGWVWSKNVQIQSTSSLSPSGGGSAAGGQPTSTTTSEKILLAAMLGELKLKLNIPSYSELGKIFPRRSFKENNMW